jgi:hypothetical protein
MNKAELKIKLVLLGVKPVQYSLNGKFEPGRVILFHNYNKWQGTRERSDQKDFPFESKACLYIYKIFRDAKEIEERFGKERRS